MTRYLLFAMVMVLSFSSSLFGGLSEEIQIACSMNVSQMGMLMSLGQIGSLISFLLLPSIAKRLGSYTLLIVGILASAFALLGMSLSRSFLLFAVFFLVSALGGYLYGTSNVLVLIASDPLHKRTSIPLMHLTFSVGSILSGLYITYLKQHIWYEGYLTMAVWYVGMAVLFMATRPAQAALWEKPQYRTLRSGFSLLGNPQFLRYLIFLVLANAVEYCTTVYPLLLLSQRLGAGAKQIGLAISILYGGSTAARLLAIPLLKTGFVAHRILIALSGVCIVGLTGFVLAPSFLPAYISLFFIGLGIGAMNPVSQILEISVWSNDLLQLANLRSMGSTLGRMILPMLLGISITLFGLASVFVVLALALGAGAFTLYTARLKPTPC
ncbi:MAG: sugar MFS transporter [Sphaerochaeta sp.]|jgi:cyanate permease|uniref:MFS transporter n=1 Tax=Sphaerochaeta sp. TaxID=1972642 RepID=UPI002FC62221